MSLYTIYLVSAVAGGTVLVLRFVLMLFGIGADHDIDIGHDIDAPHEFEGPHDLDHGGGFNLLSIQSIAGFFTMFGLVGLGLLQLEVAQGWTVAGGLAAGAITAWATAMIFFFMRRLQSEGTLKVENAIGQQGSVYLTIPESGTGVITVTVQGGQRQMDAVSRNGQRIPTGTVVRVTGITAGNILVVEAGPREPEVAGAPQPGPL